MERVKSKVYFIATDEENGVLDIQSKLARLLEKSRLLDCIRKNDKVAIKIHFGEEANTGYVRPEYVRIIYDVLRQKQTTAFLSDTNTLYKGRRTESEEHLKLAHEHGFVPQVVGAPVIIAGDIKRTDVARIKIRGKFIKEARIAMLFRKADAIVGVAHFKGHMMTGFGGALKNIGMGCATREGKLVQHGDVAPIIVADNCTGCGLCAEACPVKAISLKEGVAYLDAKRCIGCASCIAACAKETIDVNWEAGGDTIQEKMIEYAKAALQGKEKKSVFFNFALKITKECDCLAKDDPRIVADIGILASNDPVSIDKASLDLVIQAAGGDIFKQAHPRRDGNKQLEYAAALGLGSLDYELIKL